MQKKSTRVLSMVLSIAMVITMMTGVMTASAVSYKDVNSSHWAKSYIDYLSDKNVFTGYNNGTFKPDQTVTTAELMAIISRTFGLSATKAISYADVKSTDWYYPYVSQAAAQGYILDGSYVYPNQPLTREKAVAMIARYLGLETSGSGYVRFGDSSQISYAYKDYVDAAVAEGIINGYTDGTFKPQKEISRAEIAKIVYTMLGGNIIRESVTGATSNGACITKSNITVSNSYLGGTVYVTEGCGNVTINGSTITKLVVRGNTSVNLVNTKVGTLVLDSSNGSAAVYASGSSSVQSTTVNASATLTDSTTNGSAYGKVVSDMPSGGKLSLNGNFTNVILNGYANYLEIGAASKVASLTVSSAASNAKITGKGVINAIDVSASGCTTEQMPEQYVIASNLKATFAGKTYTGSGTAGVVDVIVADDNTTLAAGSTIEDKATLILDNGKNYTMVSITVPAGYKLYDKNNSVIMDNSSYTYSRTVTISCYADSYTYYLAYGSSYIQTISFTVVGYGSGSISVTVADSNTNLSTGSTISNGANLILDYGKSYTEVSITVPAGYTLYGKDGKPMNSAYNYAQTVKDYCGVGTYTYYTSYGSSYVDSISFTVSSYGASSVIAVVADDNTSLPKNSIVNNGTSLVLDSGKSYTTVTITVPKGYMLIKGTTTVRDNTKGTADITTTESCTVGSYSYYLYYGNSRVDSISFSVVAYSGTVTAVVADDNTNQAKDSIVSNGAMLILDSGKESTKVTITVPAGYKLYNKNGYEVCYNTNSTTSQKVDVTCGVEAYTYYIAYGSGSYVDSISFAVTRYGLSRPTYTVSDPANAYGSLTINFDQTMYYGSTSIKGGNIWGSGSIDYSNLVSVYGFSGYTVSVNDDSTAITLTPVTSWPSSFTVTISSGVTNKEDMTVANSTFNVYVGYSSGSSYATAPTVSTNSQNLSNGSYVLDSGNDGEYIYVSVPANHVLYVNGRYEMTADANGDTWYGNLTAGSYEFKTYYNGYYSYPVNITISTSYGSSSTTPSAPVVKDTNGNVVSGTISSGSAGVAIVRVYLTIGDQLQISGAFNETTKPVTTNYVEYYLSKGYSYTFAAVRNGVTGPSTTIRVS